MSKMRSAKLLFREWLLEPYWKTGRTKEYHNILFSHIVNY